MDTEMMRRRVFFKMMGLGAATALLPRWALAASEAKPQPNVLFISTDDLNDWAGCLGGRSDINTPNIDRLAKRGVLFTNAHNTVIVFWPDHGYHFGEKHHMAKRLLWERATRVPLIVVAPGITKPGGQCARPVNLMALYPTLVGLCGLPPQKKIEGDNIAALSAGAVAHTDSQDSGDCAE